jgi:ATP-dependent DNA ligase
MKCVPFEEKRLAKWQPPFIIQPKYDGVRCRAVPLDDGNFLLLSSEENPIFSVPHINEACKKQLPQEEFDGELYSHWHSFEEIVSITSRTVNLHPDHALISFYIFDKVTTDVQAKRTREITDLNLRPPLVKAPFWLANNLEEVMKVYDTLINQNYEGIIVRQFEAIYVRRRSNQLMKFKPKKEDTYKIIGYQEEVSIEGNPKGRLGALICESGDGNTFNVGTRLR